MTKEDRTMPTLVAPRVQKRRTALRMAGLRSVQIWVPDTIGTGFTAECQRQSALAAKSDLADTDLMNFIDDVLNDT
jgi:L-alanine-DL-glutamate epimerase-like enolase superfamily enzyme